MATIALVVAVTFAFIGISNACPTIVARAEWGARAANTTNLTTNPPTHVVIHHSATQECTSQAACANLVRSIQNTHMDTNGKADIAYNFLVGGDGHVYEGRGWGKAGAHARKLNRKSIGICFIGTFTNSLPTTASLNIARSLITCGVNNKNISSTYKLLVYNPGPGTALFKHIRNWTNWTPNP